MTTDETMGIPLPFSDKVIEKLYEHGICKNFEYGDSILTENTWIRSIPIVIAGSLKVMRTDEDGREILLYYIKQGESCIMSILGGLHHDTSKVKAIADEKTEVLFVPIDKLGFLMKDHPEWLDYIFKLYHKRFEELLEVVNAIAFKKMDERILNYLQEKKKMNGSNEIGITHQQLADELGTARVVVSRLLKHMEQSGLVKLFRNKIVLV